MTLPKRPVVSRKGSTKEASFNSLLIYFNVTDHAFFVAAVVVVQSHLHCISNLHSVRTV